VEEIGTLLRNGERDFSVGGSLPAKPDYHWTVNGEDYS